MKIRTRFAPSPTGFLHIGGLRTALYNFIYAKQNNGEFILRIEDTDQKRIIESAAEKIIQDLLGFNIKFDEGPNYNEHYGPYIQSKRLNIYKKYYMELLEQNKAYICFVDGEDLIPEKKFSKAKLKMKETPFVIKLIIPKEKELLANDEIRGKIKFNLSLIDNPIIIKSDGFPTYHFANVIDDHCMKISHVIRGEEWLPSLPKHIILYNYFNWQLPKFMHLPLLLNPDKSKLSKRQGDVHVEDFLNKGYLIDAILNYVALLGWHPKNNNEIFSLKDLYKHFSINRVQKSGAIFDIKKLNWINSSYIKKLSLNQFKNYAIAFDAASTNNYFENSRGNSDQINFNLFCDYFKDKISNLTELWDNYIIFKHFPKISDDLKKIINLDSSQKVINFWINHLPLPLDSIDLLISKTKNELNIQGKDLFFPLRILLIGKTHGPDLHTIINLLGLTETLKRLKAYEKTR